MYLSKSDYTHSRDCLAKLYFKKHKYPSKNDENQYLMYQARIGHMVGFLAQQTYAGGYEIPMEGGLEAAAKETLDWLNSHEEGVLYEATFLFDGRAARVDVLRKKGNQLELIEVKSSGFDSTLEGKDARDQVKKLEEKLYDLAFQTGLVERACPEYRVVPKLCLMDKNAVARAEGIYGNFVVEDELLPSGYRRAKVTYFGDMQELLAQELLVEWPCADALVAYKEKAWAESARMTAALSRVEDFEAFRSPKKMGCAGCVYRMMGKPREENGFAKCWGDAGFEQPSILDIRKDAGVSKFLNPWVEEGLTRLDRVDPDWMVTDKGHRVFGMPLLQIKGVREFWNEEGAALLKEAKYPLYFIDFEAIKSAIPYHAGMAPYRSIVLFQWSCHKIAAPGAPVEHFEFLNTEASYPNNRFMQSLTEVLGTEGTVFTWSSYENTQMRQFLTDVEDDAQADPEVLRRLEGLLKDRDGGWRQVDLHDDVVKRFYFHEAMKTQTSIKKVLPAVLKEAQPAANIDLLAQANLLERNDRGEITDPYLLLPGVKDGTQAMLAYDSMLYGPQSSDPAYVHAVANELRAYCKLDTLSMVLIYQYLLSKKPEMYPF